MNDEQTQSTPARRDKPAADMPVWHVLSSEQLLQRLEAAEQGLTSEEAERRLARHGPNELRETHAIRPLAILGGQFRSLLVWILIVAGFVAAALGEMVDAIAILAIVVLNGLIGFYQEFKAEKSIAALRKMTAPKARVRRDGKSLTVPAAALVPGDILEIEAGDLIAADARLLEATSLRCVESALTGESEPVDKAAVALDDEDLPLGDRQNMLFKGTSVAAGQSIAVVVATGMQTELGRIAGLIQEAGAERTPLQEKLQSFGRVLVWASLGVVTLLFGLGLMRGLTFIEMFMTSVSLAVAAVPEGLPAVVTIALALGVLRMSRRRALVRKLPSVETLGSTNVICTDKTGTLTMGDMTARQLFVAGRSYEVTGEGYGPEGQVLADSVETNAEESAALRELATVLVACNKSDVTKENGRWKVTGDPTEAALLVAGQKAGIKREDVERELPKEHEIPFSSERKRRTVVRLMPEGHLRIFINGAPDVLLRRCTKIYGEEGVRPLTNDDRRTIEQQNEAMADRALRVLGSAFRDLPRGTNRHDLTEAIEQELVFVGLVGMYDPPRPEAKAAVKRCRDAGINVVMITGDHLHTALAIARELGIAVEESRGVSGPELNKISDEDLKARVPEIAVYARVTAEHKLRIIRAWKANDAVVAMTGDGVNDAPAIKGADIGIAMGIKGTEVTKQAADMVITDDNFASIVAAVEQGRGIYDNIRKTLQYLLAGNTAELLLMTIAIVIGLPAPLLPVHLLWVNLVTDGLPALCLATDAIDPDVMRRRPRSRTERITDRGFLKRLILAGAATATVCFVVFLWALKNGSVESARSMTFTALVFCELLKSFSFRSETKPFWLVPLWSNLQLPVVVLASFGLQLLLYHVEFLSRLLKTVTPPWPQRWTLLALGFVPLIVLEVAKLLPRRVSPSAPRE